MNAALRRSCSGDLDTATLYALLALRVEAFVVEQECPYRELDGTDFQPETASGALAAFLPHTIDTAS